MDKQGHWFHPRLSLRAAKGGKAISLGRSGAAKPVAPRNDGLGNSHMQAMPVC